MKELLKLLVAVIIPPLVYGFLNLLYSYPTYGLIFWLAICWLTFTVIILSFLFGEDLKKEEEATTITKK